MPPLPTGREIRSPNSTPVSASIYKPPLPSAANCRSLASRRNIEIQIPSLIAGALAAAFAKAIAESLGNELLTHYYLSEGQKVRVDLDRVLDRLFFEFTKQLWDDLFAFYHETDSAPSRQVSLLFDGPIRQIVLILNGPEVAPCLLETLGPGLSRRKLTWSTNAKGIDLPFALRLLCTYWHRTFPEHSPGGSPDEIAKSIHSRIANGTAAQTLIASLRRIILSPHYTQIHVMESAIWGIIFKNPGPPPSDGFHITQFSFECRLPSNPDIASLPTITGAPAIGECTNTTVGAYTRSRWPKCGDLVLGCLQEAIVSRTDDCPGMSIWDQSDDAFFSSVVGVRLLHVEIEEAQLRVSVSGRIHSLIEVLQQLAWLCASLTASPFPGGALSECAVEVLDWSWVNGCAFVKCGLSHQPVDMYAGNVPPWLSSWPGAAVATGFPVDGVEEVADAMVS